MASASTETTSATGTVPTKKGILGHRAWFQDTNKEKSVRWSVEDTAPERQGPWKAPRRMSHALRSSMGRGSKPRKAMPKKDQDLLNLRNKGWDGGEENTYDSAPLYPTRRGSIVEANTQRRRSLLGSFRPADRQELRPPQPDTPVTSPNESASNSTKTKKIRRSVVFSMFDPKDDSAADLTESRQQRVDTSLSPTPRHGQRQQHRRSILGSLFRPGMDSSNSNNDYCPPKESKSTLDVLPSPTGPPKTKLDAAPLRPSRRQSVETGRRGSILGLSVPKPKPRVCDDRQQHQHHKQELLEPMIAV